MEDEATNKSSEQHREIHDIVMAQNLSMDLRRSEGPIPMSSESPIKH